ncbi:hypothetical protein [Schaalia hyovaginalis]|uniref:hypothetical protein n=1 Tax=Schaalia TaxID=2529408 RepID=UPI0026EF9A2A|nr:hypothetical protein [Schaalia hyovaginalis]MCI6557782.1 hypothetical protein [Schaalia hyovaginalis]MDD7554554.1 hypothetical protein [Schaalia hyovaginalis]MDY3093389.1 hypothetical protein [Schaalia hyovaginalis]MDY3666266.1 hypothetical protein [Schaalia hyovaginalis]
MEPEPSDAITLDTLTQISKQLIERSETDLARVEAIAEVVDGLVRAVGELTAIVGGLAERVDDSESQASTKSKLEEIRKWLALAVSTLGTLLK